MVGECILPIRERTRIWNQRVVRVSAGGNGAVRGHDIADEPGNVLCVVEDVDGLELELQRLPFRDIQALQQAEVEVVGVRQSEGITLDVSRRTRGRYDVLCRRIDSLIGNDLTGAVHQRG